MNGTRDSKGWMYISSWRDSLGLIPVLPRIAGTAAVGDAAVHRPYVSIILWQRCMAASSISYSISPLTRQDSPDCTKRNHHPLPSLHPSRTSWLSVPARVLAAISWAIAAVVTVKNLIFFFHAFKCVFCKKTSENFLTLLKASSELKKWALGAVFSSPIQLAFLPTLVSPWLTEF